MLLWGNDATGEARREIREQTLWTSGDAGPERGPDTGKYCDVTICLLSLGTIKVANVARGREWGREKERGNIWIIYVFYFPNL